jgi:hypothetical protein
MSIKTISVVALKIVRTTKILIIFEFCGTNLAGKHTFQIYTMSINSFVCQLKNLVRTMRRLPCVVFLARK